MWVSSYVPPGTEVQPLTLTCKHTYSHTHRLSCNYTLTGTYHDISGNANDCQMRKMKGIEYGRYSSVKRITVWVRHQKFNTPPRQGRGTNALIKSQLLYSKCSTIRRRMWMLTLTMQIQSIFLKILSY